MTGARRIYLIIIPKLPRIVCSSEMSSAIHHPWHREAESRASLIRAQRCGKSSHTSGLSFSILESENCVSHHISIIKIDELRYAKRSYNKKAGGLNKDLQRIMSKGSLFMMCFMKVIDDIWKRPQRKPTSGASFSRWKKKMEKKTKTKTRSTPLPFLHWSRKPSWWCKSLVTQSPSF